MGSSLRRILLWTIVALVVAYTGLGVLARTTGVIDRYFIFFPDRTLDRDPGDRGLDFEDVYFEASDGVRLNGWFGDGAFTLAVGELAADVERLLRATQQALGAGVRAAVADKHLSDISHAVETIANEAGVTVIQEYGGHGIGRELHEEPHIPNHGAPGRGPRLQVGQVIAIEPIFSLGAPEVVVDEDGWTTRTKDGSAAAHFEHTVAITKEGPRMLTEPRTATIAAAG